MANETGGVIGSAALIETTFIVTPGNSRVKTDQTFFFGDNSEVAVNDTLNINGQGWNSVSNGTVSFSETLNGMLGETRRAQTKLVTQQN
jgi:hypothetical protein